MNINRPMTVDELKSWAAHKLLPQKLIDKLDRLPERDPATVREIADEFAELGYAWTANELRKEWAPITT